MLKIQSLMRVLCALAFLIFTSAYMYFYQADVMMATQHLLSGGKTHYEPTVGAILITVALFLLHLGVLAVTKITGRAHAITYFPSLLALAMLTGLRVPGSGGAAFSFSPSVPVGIVLFVLWIPVAVLYSNINRWERTAKSRLNPLQVLWTNLLLMVVMFLFVGFTSNHDEAFHYRMKAEAALLRYDYDAALAVGQNSLVADSNLTLLRIHALASKRQMGDHLFEYPLAGGSSVMLPKGQSVRPVFYPAYQFVSYPALDFQLCRCLLDKNLDGFARILKANAATYGLGEKTDSVGKPLPKHYQEALVLYNRLRVTPLVSYHAQVLDADYEDFQKIYRAEKDARVRDAKLRDLYRNTYWYYYFFAKP